LATSLRSGSTLGSQLARPTCALVKRARTVSTTRSVTCMGPSDSIDSGCAYQACEPSVKHEKSSRGRVSGFDQRERARGLAYSGTVGEEIAPIDRENLGRPQCLCGGNERRVGEVHWVVRVSIHQLEGSRERALGKEPHRDPLGVDERTQCAGSTA